MTMHILLLGLVLILSSSESFGVPAAPGLFEFSQPDGSKFKARIKGDEFYHHMETSDGYSVSFNKDSDSYEYLNVDASGKFIKTGLKAGIDNPTKHGIPRNLREKDSVRQEIISKKRASRSKVAGQEVQAVQSAPSGALPQSISGTVTPLVILVNFSDTSTTYSSSVFNSLFNTPGYNLNGAVGSVKDYFNETSYNQLNVQATISAWVTLSHPMSWYGANDAYGEDLRPREMVLEAINLLNDSGFDFSPFDANHDGLLDYPLDVIHHGGGEEAGAGANTIWSHAWSLAYPGVTVDGVKIQAYHTEPELYGTGLTTIGVICHEMGHSVCSLPDLYDTDNSSEGIGEWCLMASGSWNGSNGERPAHMSAWAKLQCGWVTAQTLAANQTGVSVLKGNSNQSIFKITNGMQLPNEYLLVENRQKSGFDDGLPGPGLLVWHIDDNMSDNTNEAHYMVALLQADGNKNLENNVNRGDGGDPYPGTSGNRTISSATNPNTNSYTNGATSTIISSISNSADTMTFNLGLTPDTSYTLTVSNNGNGTTVPSGASTQTGGAAVSIAATPATGYYFVNWTVTSGTATFANANSATTTVTASAAATITANFVVNNVQITTNVTALTVNEGSTNTFQVRLTLQPTASKTVSVSRISGGDSDITVSSGSSLTFTTSNWGTYQTVTLAAAEDPDSTNGSAITRCSSSGMTDKDVTATENDNDIPGFMVSSISGNTTEAGGIATFTVRLNTQPTADVSFNLSSSDSTEGTVSPSSLTFTSANWNNTQTVTVTGVDDALVDGNIAFSIVTGAATSADPNYNGLNPADVSVTNTDNDVAGFALSKSTMTIAENGGTDTFTVVLTAQPASNVVFSVTSSATGEATVSPATLTFAPASWNSAQTVTVTGVNDNTVATHSATITVSVVDATSDNNWDPLANKTVDVTCTNDDVAGFTVSSISGNTTETGGTATFTVKLNTQPSANVTIAISSSDTSEGIVSPSSLTFTSANWNNTQTVTVTGVNDAIIDGDMAYSIVTGAATSSDPNYNGLNPSDVPVINVDNDYTLTVGNDSNGTTVPSGASVQTKGVAASISATPSAGYHFANWTLSSGTVTFASANSATTTATASADAAILANFAVNDVQIIINATSLSVNEGSTATFMVKLSAQPVADKTVSVSRTAGDSDISVTGGANLIFTTSNWNSYQTVTLSAAEDPDNVNGSTTITCASAGSSSRTVTATETDNEIPGYLLGSTSGNITEAGGTATFTMKLNCQPSSDVSFTLSSSDSTEGTVSPPSLTFTSANWNVTQTVTVTGVDDALLDGNIAFSIVTGAATSADPGYNGLKPPDIAVTNFDNDYTLTIGNDGNGTTVPSGATAVTKGSAAPIAATPNTGYHFVNWTVTSGSATFASANSASTTITASATAAIRANFAINNVQITTDVTSLSVNEGAKNSFQVKLTMQPTVSKTVSVSRIPGDGDITVSSGSSLTFTTLTWDTYQTVTLAAAQDADTLNGSAIIRCSSIGMGNKDITATEADNDYTLTVNNDGYGSTSPSGAVVLTKGSASPISATANIGYHFLNWSTSGTAEFAAVNSASTTVTATTDATIRANFAVNDVQIITDVSSLSVNEGATNSFRVKLSAQPTASRTVAVSRSSGGDSDISIISNPSLLFNTTSWDTYQPVTLAAAEDTDTANGSAIIRCSSTGMGNKDITAAEADNDYTLTVGNDGNGSSTPSGASVQTKGAAISITATPTTGYHFANWTVTGGSASFAKEDSASTTVTATTDTTVRTNFEINTYTLTYAAGANGTITTGTTPQTVNHGASGTAVTAAPNVGYHFTDWSDGSTSNPRQDTDVTSNMAVSANFAIDTHVLSYLAVNGTISGNASQKLDYGSDGTSVTAVPNADRYFLSWSDGLKSLTRQENNVTADATFTANFRTNVFGEPSSIFNLSDTVGGQKIFIIDGLVGQKFLTVELKNVSGDCDLYLKHASQPTLQLYNFKSTNGPGMSEIITVPNPADGKWYIMVYAYDRYSGATLSVDYGTVILGTPTNLAASAGTPPDKQISLTWNAAIGAASYEIYRCDEDIPELATKINTAGEVTGTAYNDEFSVAGYYRYYYWVRSVNGAGVKGGFSESAEGATTEGDAVPLKNATELKGRSGAAGEINAYSINIPDNLQTLLEIRISTGTGDCDFDVVSSDGTIVKPRAGVNGNALVQIASPANGDWKIHLYGRTAYSGLSLMAKYIKQTAVPTAPAGVNASDGLFDNKIVVSWTAVSGASSYVVGRKNSLADVGFEQEFETAAPIFEDNSQAVLEARPGTLFYYFIAAKNSFGPGNYSTGNSGYLSKSPLTPGTVTASNGTYFDKIHVSWAQVNGATSYLVFRTESVTIMPRPNTDTYLIGETTALFFDDFGNDDYLGNGLDITKKYYYWIAAKNANATTAISKPNDGYLSNKGPATVTASNGIYSDRIVVTWTAVPGATAYDVYRYNDPKFTDTGTKVGDKVTAFEHEDIQVAAGRTYYYKVNAKYEPGNYDSALSLKGAAGKLGSITPPPLEKSYDIADMPIGSSLYFSIDVPMGKTRMVATLAGNEPPLGKTNDCDLFARFANFPTTALYNAKGIENKTNEILTVSNPAAGTWYFMLYATTHCTDVSLTVSYYAVADIVLTQVPANNLPFPFTAKFTGKVVDDAGAGIPGIVIQTRNPITGLTSSLTKTDANGIFSYSALINFEGEHTFDFFFTEIPDNAKGTASHTVATRKSCLETNNFFDSAAYMPATPVPLPVQADIAGLQTFLNIRNGWNNTDPGDPYETIWLNNTLFKSEHDAQLLAKLDEGLYMFFYGVEGAGVGNDTTPAPALSAVPLVVHVAPGAIRGTVLDKLIEIGIIDQTQKDAILSGNKIGVVTVAALRNPIEGQNEGDRNISLLGREQLEVLADIAGNTANIAFIDGRKDSSTVSKLITITLASGREINVIAYAFLK